jgi:hypothetical protein
LAEVFLRHGVGQVACVDVNHSFLSTLGMLIPANDVTTFHRQAEKESSQSLP